MSQYGMKTSSGYVKSVSSKSGLHFKMHANTKETKKYARQIKDMGPQVINKHLQQWMRQVMSDTKRYLKNRDNGPEGRVVWERKSGFWDESESAMQKIAKSLTVRETKAEEKGQVAVSMWSQDQERPERFDSAGVRGSRARSGRTYEGKIAQYYEQGRGPFTISGTGIEGKQTFTHKGYPRLGYMARARNKVVDKFINHMDRVLEQNLSPGATVSTRIGPTRGGY
tara:strand:+ start:4512 stop:5186 length:675 start_codon:yes stop_codon:yes gene_type:complete